MKYSVYILALVLAAVTLLIPPPSTLARNSEWPHSHEVDHNHGQEESSAWPRIRDDHSTIRKPAYYGNGDRKEMMEERNAHPLQIAGSRLPDCTHACGSCSPCKLVIVGSLCASLDKAAAETCPVSYRCMCKNKSYPVP